MDSKSTPVICLMGTTATGKTDAAAFLSKHIDGEIISVDSSLVYRGMDIGTAKPDPDFLAQYPHHLVDIRNPNDTYSVADFYAQASAIIDDICARGKVPILAGGTNFYFSALEKGLSDLPQANAQLRADIDVEADKIGWQKMHQYLAELDPQSGERIDPMDAQRIQRALEIVLQSGRAVAEHDNTLRPAISRPLLKIALAYSDRSYLHQRIEQRFDMMLEQGLQREVEALIDSGVDPQTPAMRMIGYRQMLEFLQCDLTSKSVRDRARKELRLKGVAATRQLAKRQLTWLRNQSNIVWWVDSGLKQKNYEQLNAFVTHFVI